MDTSRKASRSENPATELAEGASAEQATVAPRAKIESPKCGLVMPISSSDGYEGSHWSDVRRILTDAVEAAGFIALMVSDADDSGVIQKRIVQNLYENPIVVCDISGRNPNVMFELGMRLAFDKPTIVVKDDCTNFVFDTSSIEHLIYPKDLRYWQIEEFKEKLSAKIQGTYEKSVSDPEYTTFLKHFGTFKPVKVGEINLTDTEIILDELSRLRTMVSRLDYPMQKRVIRRNPMAFLQEAVDLLRHRGITTAEEFDSAYSFAKEWLIRDLGPKYFDGMRECDLFIDANKEMFFRE